MIFTFFNSISHVLHLVIFKISIFLHWVRILFATLSLAMGPKHGAAIMPYFQTTLLLSSNTMQL